MPEVGPRLADCSPETRLFLPIQFHLPEKSHYQVLLERFHLSSFGVYQDLAAIECYSQVELVWTALPDSRLR